MRMIIAQIRPALVSLLALTLITGGLYPLAVTGVAQVAFPSQANGSLIVENGQVRGSALIGQPFDDPRYFWGRLSATDTFADNAYNAATLTASSGSNLGPLNPALAAAVKARIAALRAADPQVDRPYPADLVTASASGLDPQISPAAAAFQVRRVARARGMSEDQVRQLVATYTEGRDLGVLGEPRVHVLKLNLALDDQ
ncbi:MAG: potassium-transporting ATPase subunit KdpC [Chloroflexales bacterium]